jgi:hypothetical protein
MRKSIYLFGLLNIALFIFSCGEDSSKKELTREDYKASIKQMEDSISTIQKDPEAAAKMPSLTNIELINRLIAYYHAFPKDEYAADCLFKVHMKYGELQAHQNAVAYGDTLLKSFPNYKNRDFVLESLGSSYDIYIEPRDTSKVRYYYELLLKEKTVKNDKKAEIRARLKYLHLDLFEYINFQNSPISKKVR